TQDVSRILNPERTWKGSDRFVAKAGKRALKENSKNNYPRSKDDPGCRYDLPKLSVEGSPGTLEASKMLNNRRNWLGLEILEIQWNSSRISAHDCATFNSALIF
ncbi:MULTISPECIES: hypothetical protein, partial [unclassified Bradyrhizobium]